MQAPERYVQWINENIGFNPRAQKQSNALSGFIIDDLRAYSPRVDSDCRTGLVVTNNNANVATRIHTRNVDLVLSVPFVVGPLDRVRVAIEHKSLMTAHGKARKNRLGDIVAFANHVHNHSLRAIAAATMVVNVSPQYRNPDSFATDIIRTYGNMEHIVSTSVRLYLDLPLRDAITEPNDQPEAILVMVVDYDGQNPARLVTDPPAPQQGQPGHYGWFLERLARLYEERFPKTAE